LPSSICGGGRYDDLTGIFGLQGMSGVGISFGADRIYDVLLETNKFPAELGSSTKLLFANFGEGSDARPEVAAPGAQGGHRCGTLSRRREDGQAVQVRRRQGHPFVAIIGENEMKQGIVTMKDMKNGEQKAVKRRNSVVGCTIAVDTTAPSTHWVDLTTDFNENPSHHHPRPQARRTGR
jgi:histidyl-tRNA synthetase